MATDVPDFQSHQSVSRQPTMMLLLSLLLLFPGLANAQDTNHDVVIVGAGSAGLYAAYTLDNLGFDVLVIEARPRIGGRIHPLWQRQWDPNFWINSSDSQVITVETGAQEVESSKNNFLQDDINAAFPGRLVPCFTYDSNQQALFESGAWHADATVRYPGDVSKKNTPEIYDYWDFYTTSTTGKNHAAGISVLDDLAAGGPHSAGITPSDPEFHLYLTSPGASFQARLDDLEVRSYGRLASVWPYGDGTNCFKGNEGYLKTLNALYFDDIIHLVSLDNPVTEINTQAGPRPYAVANGGDKHYADAIIVTVPVGRLLSTDPGGITFVPPLPTTKTDAYATLNGQDVGGKVILKWDSIFWNTDVGYMVTDGPATQCWNEGIHKDIPAADKRVWACLISPDAHDTYLTGLTKSQIQQAVAADFLDSWSGGSMSNLEDSYYADWGGSMWTKGAYSSAGFGSWPTTDPDDSMHAVAAAQIGTSLYFAGEATNKNGGSSVVIGAMETGERAALEIDVDHDPRPAPTADFSAAETSGIAPFDAVFTDLSTEYPASWAWTFGDTGTSTEQHPTHQYLNPGTYEVILTATNPAGSDHRGKDGLHHRPGAVRSACSVPAIIGLMLLDARRRSYSARSRRQPLFAGRFPRDPTAPARPGIIFRGRPSQE